jgi:anaerobic selenocysteine-containing dehydrogenase
MEIITVEQMNEACDAEFKEYYSHGGYCHEQSFRFGFQEGVEYAEKKVKDILLGEVCKILKENISKYTTLKTNNCYGVMTDKELETFCKDIRL